VVGGRRGMIRVGVWGGLGGACESVWAGVA